MPAALAAASSASLSLLRRANASTGVSPARIREVAIFNGVFPGDSTLGETTAGALTPEAVGGGVGTGGGRIVGAFKSGTTMFDCHRGLRRLACLCPSSRLSQSRRASSDTRTSRPRSPLASASTEAPSRRNRSSSSRCGASANAIDLRGQRACATNSAKVGGTVGASSCGDCGVVGVMWEQYSDRCGSAMGAVWVRSKPTGLDVGVLCHGFLWVRLKKCCRSRLMPLVGMFGGRLVDGRSMVGRRLDDGFWSECCTLLKLDQVMTRWGIWFSTGSYLAWGVLRLVRGGAC